MTDDIDHSSPIGVVGNDGDAVAIATTIAGSGRRVLYYPTTGTTGTPEPPKTPGLERASTLTDVAYESDFVLAAIEDTVSLRALVLGSGERLGLAAEMKPGAVLADLGARTPRELQALLGVLGRRGVALVDAAIIGETDAIAEARCIVLLGGFPDAVALAAPALSTLGKIERTGPLGSAHASAALMGYIEAAHSVAREQAMALGRSCGVEPELMSRFLAQDLAGKKSTVVPLARRAELARRIAEDGRGSGEIIDFAAKRRARSDGENR